MREKIIKAICRFFILLGLHFIAVTFIRFVIGTQIKFLSSSNINLWKDLYLFVIYGWILWDQYKKKGLDIKSYFVSKNHLVVSSLIGIFFLIALIISVVNGISPKGIFLGIKYDFLILLPIIFFPMLRVTRQEFGKIFDYFLYSIKIILSLSTIFMFIRLVKDSALRHLGFSFVDTQFSPDARPPTIYKTADQYLVPRESGIFSGPNSLGFYVAFILPILSYYIKMIKPVFRVIGWGSFVIAIILLFKTLSRTAMIVVVLEAIAIVYFIFVANNKKNLRYVAYVIAFAAALGYWGVTRSGGDIQLASIFVRSDSNNGHAINTMEGVNYFLKYPIGYGLGTAGPAAVQMDKGIVPENRWVQIFLETGLLGGIVYIAMFISLLKILFKNFDYKKLEPGFLQNYQKYFEQENLGTFLGIGLCGIMAAGMLLHSFEDSMVNLTMFSLIGLYIGLKETGFVYGKEVEKKVIENKFENRVENIENSESQKSHPVRTISYSYHKPKKKKSSHRK